VPKEELNNRDKMKNSTTISRAMLYILTVGFASGTAHAQPGVADSGQPGDELDPIESGEVAQPVIEDEPEWDFDEFNELDDTVDLMFEDFDVVITASRSEQASNKTGVPVSIISADDIRYSGVTELPAIFDFVPGFDALRIDRNRWALGVRGMHQTFSDRTLFLLDGRNASNALYGGVDFQALPIFLDNIKQVEVVRGPGGAAWGANAFNGVVNVINKDPSETTGFLIRQQYTEHNDFITNVRVGDKGEKLAWRFSSQYNDISDSDTVNIFTGLAVAPAAPDDFQRSQKYGLDAVYQVSDQTKFDFGFSGSHVERGDSPFLALQLGLDERLDLLRSYAKFSHEYDSGALGYLQWYGTYQDVNRPSMFRYNTYDNNFDGQYSFDASDNHNLTFGGALRLVDLDISSQRPTDALPAGTSSEQWAGIFVSDRWDINDRWTLESQLRTDYYSETSLDWAGRVALLRSVGESDAHVIRLAAAKAFRTPQTALRDLSSERIALGGGLFGVNLIPAVDMANEELYSIELGYTGKIRDGLTLRSDTYYQRYNDLSGVVSLPEPVPVVGRSFFTIDNIGSADAYGIETELKYRHDDVAFSVWHTYSGFQFESAGQNARAFRPSKNKVGATARYHAADWLTLNANYRFSDETPGDSTAVVSSYHRLDLSTTFKLASWNSEIQLGVYDVADQTDLLIFDQSSTGAGQRTPGRTFFLDMTVSF
jgi:outer membrane receptor protein involved in Fe transport